MKGKERARVSACMLLIAWNPSGELETLPSDQPPASLALSLKRRTARKLLHQTICDIQFIYRTVGDTLDDIFGEMSGLLFHI